jgi:hypothetical protein
MSLDSSSSGKPALTLLPEKVGGWKGFALRLGTFIAATSAFIAYMISMPGKSYSGTFAAPTSEELQVLANLRADTTYLAGNLGERNLDRYKNLNSAAQYVEDSFGSLGYLPQNEEFTVQGMAVRNILVEIHGGQRANEIVLVGAHYDSVYGCPGADDNATGVAALLEIARELRGHRPSRTIRLVAWVNEEPPYFQTPTMGSWVNAKRAHQRNDNIVAAISLETIGTYTDVPDSQHYPAGFSLFFPSKGNFVGFVGNLSSRSLVRDSIECFRRTTQFPSEGIAAPAGMTGIGWSDHWSYWQEGYPAIMISDSALFRNPNYHKLSDTPEKLNYESMSRVVIGIGKLVKYLGG